MAGFVPQRLRTASAVLPDDVCNGTDRAVGVRARRCTPASEHHSRPGHDEGLRLDGLPPRTPQLGKVTAVGCSWSARAVDWIRTL